MRLKAIIIHWPELQDYLDKYQDKVKFILPMNNGGGPQTYCIIIDES